MIVVEYRIPLPIALDEYNRALRYVIARVADAATGLLPGEGVEIVKNEPFGPGDVAGMPDGGIYTEKVLRFRSRLPPILRRFIPLSATKVFERSWLSNSRASRCRTVYRNPFLGDRFHLSIESNHLDGVGNEENAIGLDDADLAQRQVFCLDIAANVPRKLPGEDPCAFASQKCGRGPLQQGWWKLPAAPVLDAENLTDADEERNTELSEDTAVTISDGGKCAVLQTSAVGNSGYGSASAGASSSGADNSSAISMSKYFGGLNTTQTMCCYKVVKMEFTGFGLRRFIQRWATRGVIPNGFIDIHRKMYVWMDSWLGLSIEDLQKIEQRTAENVNAKIHAPATANEPADAAVFMDDSVIL